VTAQKMTESARFCGDGGRLNLESIDQLQLLPLGSKLVEHRHPRLLLMLMEASTSAVSARRCVEAEFWQYFGKGLQIGIHQHLRLNHFLFCVFP
jgi:hypothetical protein